jgi:hypothetical protein
MNTGSSYKLQNKRNKIVLLPFLLIFIWMFSRSLLLSSGDVSSIETVVSTSPIPENNIDKSLSPPEALSSTSKQQNEFDFNSSKKILYFNNYFHLMDHGFGSEPFISAKCPQTNCFLTNDRKLLGSLADFDAILFHARDMDKQVIQVSLIVHDNNH